MPQLSRQRTFDLSGGALSRIDSVGSANSASSVHSVHSTGSVGSGNNSTSSGVYDVGGKRKVDAVAPGANVLGTSSGTSGGTSSASASGGIIDGGDVISPAKKLKGAWSQAGESAQVCLYIMYGVCTGVLVY